MRSRVARLHLVLFGAVTLASTACKSEPSDPEAARWATEVASVARDWTASVKPHLEVLGATGTVAALATALLAVGESTDHALAKLDAMPVPSQVAQAHGTARLALHDAQAGIDVFGEAILVDNGVLLDHGVFLLMSGTSRLQSVAAYLDERAQLPTATPLPDLGSGYRDATWGSSEEVTRSALQPDKAVRKGPDQHVYTYNDGGSVNVSFRVGGLIQARYCPKVDTSAEFARLVEALQAKYGATENQVARPGAEYGSITDYVSALWSGRNTRLRVEGETLLRSLASDPAMRSASNVCVTYSSVAAVRQFVRSRLRRLLEADAQKKQEGTKREKSAMERL